MAKEPDQTKWVGVRPTDPSENIPVTESSPLASIKVEPKEIITIFKTLEQAPLPQIKVEPLAAGTIFKTATEKRAPAIGDMQAVEEMHRGYVNEAKGATPHINDLYTVPAGKIYMLTMLYATASVAIVDTIDVACRVDLPPVIGFPLAYWTHTAVWEAHSWFGSLPINEGEVIRFQWLGGAAGGTVIAAMMGYLIDKY